MEIVKPSAELIWITPNAEQEIERAGRTCYKSEDKITDDSAGAFIRMVMKRGHESVIEHASASFRFICDRGVTHEMVRHRLAAYSQESTRYCNYGTDKHGGQISSKSGNLNQCFRSGSPAYLGVVTVSPPEAEVPPHRLIEPRESSAKWPVWPLLMVSSVKRGPTLVKESDVTRNDGSRTSPNAATSLTLAADQWRQEVLTGVWR